MVETHCLKIKSEFYDDVVRRVKNAEVRYNDRNFKEGDRLVLCEINEEGATGRECVRRIIKMYDLTGIGLNNWVLMFIG